LTYRAFGDGTMCCLVMRFLVCCVLTAILKAYVIRSVQLGFPGRAIGQGVHAAARTGPLSCSGPQDHFRTHHLPVIRGRARSNTALPLARHAFEPGNEVIGLCESTPESPLAPRIGRDSRRPASVRVGVSALRDDRKRAFAFLHARLKRWVGGW